MQGRRTNSNENDNFCVNVVSEGGASSNLLSLELENDSSQNNHCQMQEVCGPKIMSILFVLGQCSKFTCKYEALMEEEYSGRPSKVTTDSSMGRVQGLVQEDMMGEFT